MQPTDYPPGWPVQPHAGVLPTATPTQTDQPAENTVENMFSVFQAATSGFFSEIGDTIFAVDNRVTDFFDAVEDRAISAFNNFFTDQSPILLLTADTINQVFTNVTDDKDLYSFTLTCKALSEMGRAPPIRLRTRHFRIMSMDIVQAYAQQPIATIVPGSFKARVAGLIALCPNISIATLECALREVIRTHHRDEMRTLAAQYLDHFPCNPNVGKLKCDLGAELMYSLTKTQHKIKELCGDNFNGTINTAYQSKIAAEAKLNAALSALQFVCDEPVALKDALSLDISNTVDAYEIKEAHAHLIDANNAFEAAKAQFEGLRAALDTLAVWTGGNITGGAFHEIGEKLANLDNIARVEAIKLGRFYAELSDEVHPIEQDLYSEMLHFIIG